MQYAVLYGFLLTGQILTGKNAGQRLVEQRQEVIDCSTLEEAVAKAKGYEGKFRGLVSVYSRQYSDTQKGFVFKYETDLSLD